MGIILNKNLTKKTMNKFALSCLAAMATAHGCGGDTDLCTVSDVNF